MSKSKAEQISSGIKELIQSMMDRVLIRVLEEDPFILEQHYSSKPLYAALVPDEIFKGSHFERRFVTPFGRVWEKLAVLSAKYGLGYSELGKTISGNIPQERLRRISEILANLEHPSKEKKRKTPNWSEELSYILEGQGKLLPTQVVCDVYAEDVNAQKKYAFELKSPLPNSDITKVSKEKIFKLYSMEPRIIDGAFFVLPYNPYGKRENYAWTFPMRWFNMRSDSVVLIGEEFWDFIGGIGTYQMFISEINKLGLEYKNRIYREYLQIEPPQNKTSYKL